MISSIVASLLLAAAGGSVAEAAAGERVAVLVVPRSAAVFRSAGAAHGLLVPGQGSEVSRRGALASLLRGKLENSLVGGVPSGSPSISLAHAPARVTFYVALPLPGSHHNVVRYPLAVVGAGYHGILVSSSTRLAGLMSIADVAPSVRALARGERPRIRARPEADPLGRLARLDRRIDQSHDTRVAAMSVLAALVTVLGLLTLATRSAAVGRAAFLAAPVSVVTAVALSAIGVATPWAATLALALLASAGSIAGGALLRPRVPLAVGIGACFAFLFAVMWAEPQWNILSAIGPHPDGGGRFYGMTNQVETLLLAPALVLGALAGVTMLPAVALLVAAGTAASRIGADGGGLVVYLAGFLVLSLRLRGIRVMGHGVARTAVAVAIAAGAALAVVGIDAATGGSSHVTRAVGGGPSSLAGDFAHRVHLSATSIGSAWNVAFLFALSTGGLLWLAFRRPRLAVLDALLVALAVSLVVNDTPVDVVGWGALSALVIRAWARTGERLGPLE